MKRTLIEPVQGKAGRGKGGKRLTAKERKKAHDERELKKKKANMPEAPAPKVSVAKAAPAEVDVELAAEIAAMKGDDARKGKFYNRKRDI